MVEFYKYYIHPASPSRAKLAVHLSAQTPAPAPTNLLTSTLENGKKVLALNSAITVHEKEAEAPKIEENGTTPLVITDVRRFKSMLQVSAGPQPVKYISEFEELDAKL